MVIAAELEPVAYIHSKTVTSQFGAGSARKVILPARASITSCGGPPTSLLS
jgi:hypothetical protein